MNFHLPSFLLGFAAGAAGTALWERLRPVAVELASAGYELGENLWNRVATLQEDAEDVLAEARARSTRRAPARHVRRTRRTHRRARAGAS
jgi:hypothetical protein